MHVTILFYLKLIQLTNQKKLKHLASSGPLKYTGHYFHLMKNEFIKCQKDQVKKHFNYPLLPKLISIHNFKRALNPENLFLLSQTAATKKYCKNQAQILVQICTVKLPKDLFLAELKYVIRNRRGRPLSFFVA